MGDWISESDDGDKFEWSSDSDDEAAGSPHGTGSLATASRNVDASGPSTLDLHGRVGSTASLVEHFVAMGMGFTREMVLKAIKDNGNGDEGSLFDLLLTYKAIRNDPSADNWSASGWVLHVDEDDDDILKNWDAENIAESSNRSPDSDDSNDEYFLKEMSQHDEKAKSLMGMGFSEAIAGMAVTRCGHAASMCVLVDWIHASEIAGDGCRTSFSDHEDNSCGGRPKTRQIEENMKKRKRFRYVARRSREPVDGSHDDPMPLPKPMTGFNLPDGRPRSVGRCLVSQAIGPPFFYYENVALAPKGVWAEMSRFLYDIKPEFVDSKFFCACVRKRGYIHNLPIENRSPLHPLPPKTISEAFPSSKKYWPPWDPRKQFNCLQTCVASVKLTESIRSTLANSEGPSLRDQKDVLVQCRKWNLLWVGKNKVAPLEPHEMEMLLGFPRDHTRGISRTERYRSLGNSFQVDTVAYHLSVLKDIFPHGINVLSLFSGIGGAEVALHRLGIHMKTVVSVEKADTNRAVLRSWWDQTQTGTLIEIADVQSLTSDRIESFIGTIGGFDLVIGGSPCNNLTGSNRHHRDGLEGEQSALFYDYVRILDTVKSIMQRV